MNGIKMGKWPSEVRLENAFSSNHKFNFTEADYLSGDGIQTAIFGPVFWTAIHMVSFNYPVQPTAQQKADYANWLMATGKILPCKYCRDNFEKNIQAAQKCNDFDSRDAFSRFCYRLHCEVNSMLNKSTNITFEEVRDMYEGFRSRCLTNAQKQALQRENKELGCVAPAHDGTKGKCVISIVPRNETYPSSFRVSDACRPNFSK